MLPHKVGAYGKHGIYGNIKSFLKIISILDFFGVVHNTKYKIRTGNQCTLVETANSLNFQIL